MSAQIILRRLTTLPAGPGAAQALIEPAMSEHAGGGRPLSLTLDFGPQAAAGAAVEVEVWEERATRRLSFLQGRIARADDGRLVAQASAVFTRGQEGSNPR